MATTLGIFALILGTILFVWIGFQIAPNSLESAIRWIDKGRAVIGILFLVIIGWHLLNSGVLYQQVLALSAIAFVVGWAIVFEPHKNEV